MLYSIPGPKVDPTTHHIAMQSPTLNVVDFSSFTDSTDKQNVSNAILSSLQSIGFVCITNHGLPDESVQAMFEWVFFLSNSIQFPANQA
jgi:hypothetical protein